MKLPLKYYGGKTYQADWIVGILNRYAFKTYVEPFGGSGAILFAKEPSGVEIYNDIYSDVVTFYRVLRNPRQYKQLIQFIEHTPYSREAFQESREALKTKKLSAVEQAGHFFVRLRQSFSCNGTAWSTPGKEHRNQAKAYRSSIDRFSQAHERLRNVHIEHKDALAIIRRYAYAESMIYCDPPYVHSTRVAVNTYAHEYTDEAHTALVTTLLEVPGHKILSGYEHDIYLPLLDAGWTLEKRDFPCHSSRHKKGYRTECLYCSPLPAP